MNNKLDSQDEINTFFRNKLSKLTQEEVENLNRSVTSKEIESVKSPNQRKAQDQMASLVNSTKR